jgi:DNA polymerase IIIc chi subunit
MQEVEIIEISQQTLEDGKSLLDMIRKEIFKGKRVALTIKDEEQLPTKVDN